MAVREGWRSLSGLVREIVRSIGQGNFTFVRECREISKISSSVVIFQP